jgi:hypothetical protein
MADPTLTAEEFLEQYPEFKTAGPLVQLAIDFALPQLSAEVYEDAYLLAVGLLAADWLCTHPYGRSQRSDDDKDKPSRYRIQLDKIMLQRVPRFLVV